MIQYDYLSPEAADRSASVRERILVYLPSGEFSISRIPSRTSCAACACFSGSQDQPVSVQFAVFADAPLAFDHVVPDFGLYCHWYDRDPHPDAVVFIVTDAPTAAVLFDGWDVMLSCGRTWAVPEYFTFP